MNKERACHAAILTRDGRVLIIGSYNDQSAELYDPGTGKFSMAGGLIQKRDGFAATLLPNGKVLITGGYAGGMVSSAELYDPATGKSAPAGSTGAGRAAHTQTLLTNGKVLITGGGFGSTVLAIAEVYDPAAGTFSHTGSMAAPRHKHATRLLQDGRVVIVGGADSHDWQGRYRSAAIYDPSTGRFDLTGSMGAARFKLNDAVALLTSGKLLVAGAGERAEIYDPASRAFALAEGQMDAARYYAAVSLLPDGKVLITGGYDRSIAVSAKAWVYRP